MPLISVAARLNIKLKNGMHCPFHDDETPSFHFNQAENSWRCYGECAIGGKAIKFVETALKCGFLEAVSFLRGNSSDYSSIITKHSKRFVDRNKKSSIQTNVPMSEPDYEVYNSAFQLLRLTQDVLTYFVNERGFSKEIVEQFKIGKYIQPDEVAANLCLSFGYERIFKSGMLSPLSKVYNPKLIFSEDRAIIPFFNHGNYEYFQGRKIIPCPKDERWRCLGNKVLPRIFNAEELDANNNIRIHEGVTDTLSSIVMGKTGNIGILGSNCDNIPSNILAQLRGKNISIVPDNDTGGATFLKKICPQLETIGVFYRIQPPPSNYNDMNDYLLKKEKNEKL